MELTFAQKENIGLKYVLDALRPCSAYGQALLREMRPMGPGQRAEILTQLENIRRFYGQESLAPLQQLLRLFMGLKMIRPTVEKCRNEDLNPIELFEVKRFLLQSREMLPLFAQVQAHLQPAGMDFLDTEEALNILDPERNRVASFFLPDSISPRLAQLRAEKRQLEATIREDPAPAHQAARTRVAAEEEQEEMRIHGLMSRALRPHIPAMLSNMDAIARLDLTAEKARIARRYGAAMPVLTENTLSLTEMVNPRILDLLAGEKKTFTPISIALDRGAAVITGANMGGKSVALKTLALNILLVHYGFFPFAKAARIPLFDGMHIISEDLESIDRGLSSFGGEMVRFNAMAACLGQGFHFVLLDEFARGTNPHEGAAIVRAVTRYLNAQNAISVLATHYDHVAEAANAHYQVAGLKDLDWESLNHSLLGLSPQARVGQITACMNYGLYPVRDRQDCPRDALHICRLLGMEPQILADAEKTVADTGKIG